MYIMPKKPKDKKTAIVSKETMLDKGRRLVKEKPVRTLLEAYSDIIKQKERDDRWFEDKVKALRQQTKEIFLDEDEQARKYLTKNQSKSEIIGAKEYRKDEAPDKMRVYIHYAKKYGIPYSIGTHKKTLEDIIKDIHAHEMKYRDLIIKKNQLDPLTKTYGLYIM